MHVCILTSVHSVGDTRIYHRQAKSLARAGYQVTLVATGVESQRVPDESIEILGLKRPSRRIGRALGWPCFIRAALQSNADIYHFHDPDLLFVGACLQALTGKPVIYDNHDPYVEAISQREWLPYWLRPIVARVFNLIEKGLAGRLAAVIVANDAQLARFPRAALVRNYPDLQPFKQPGRQARSCPPVVIHVGMLTEARGVFDMVEIARWLAHRQISFRLLGPFANPGMEAAIRQTVAELYLERLVQIEGRVSHEQVVEGLMRATVGLIPYRLTPNHEMIIPTKLFEYMACGLPVVASDLPPIRAYVVPIGCGLLVPPGEPRAFAQAIEYLLDRPDEAREMGERGRQAVFERYHWQTQEQELLSLYRKLLSPC